MRQRFMGTAAKWAGIVTSPAQMGQACNAAGCYTCLSSYACCSWAVAGCHPVALRKHTSFLWFKMSLPSFTCSLSCTGL